MSDVSPLIEIEHLTMRFGGLLAVDDVSFTASAREITAIIGPNGAGKTTVFNCITGFYKPTIGRLTLRGDRDYLLERMLGHEIGATREGGAHVPEHSPVSRHDRAGEPDGRAAQQADAGLGHERIRAARPRSAIGSAEAAAVEKARDWLERIGLVA